MKLTNEQNEALSEYASVAAKHVLRWLDVKQNPDTSFKSALAASTKKLEECRRRLKGLGVTPLF
ncbi:MAG: hypothetical protein ACREQR_13540 [Candidatus Binataceae bacterium]